MDRAKNLLKNCLILEGQWQNVNNSGAPKLIELGPVPLESLLTFLKSYGSFCSNSFLFLSYSILKWGTHFFRAH